MSKYEFEKTTWSQGNDKINNFDKLIFFKIVIIIQICLFNYLKFILNNNSDVTILEVIMY